MKAMFLLLPAAVFGQAFDVTSVKPDNHALDRSRRSELECSPGGRFVSRGNLLIRPIMFAWDVPGLQVSGMPGWAAMVGVSDAYFEIEGRSEAPVTLDQCRLMVQALLADRFKLKVHHETKEISVYALVVGKNGPKMKEADPSKPGAGARMNGRPMRIAPDGKETLLGWTTGYLADALTLTTQQLDGRRVVDRTGLKGVYEFNLQFDEFPNPAFGHHDQPDVFVAVEEQLGLKLEQRKELFDIIVVDHMEKPSAN
jgi:bla regulator protein blaR1